MAIFEDFPSEILSIVCEYEELLRGSNNLNNNIYNQLYKLNKSIRCKMLSEKCNVSNRTKFIKNVNFAKNLTVHIGFDVFYNQIDDSYQRSIITIHAGIESIHNIIKNCSNSVENIIIYMYIRDNQYLLISSNITENLNPKQNIFLHNYTTGCIVKIHGNNRNLNLPELNYRYIEQFI